MDHIEQASEIQSGIRLVVYLLMVFIQLVFGVAAAQLPIYTIVLLFILL